MRKVRQNPREEQEFLAEKWDVLRKAAGDSLMPKTRWANLRGEIAAIEYGSGKYGTVFPTRTSGFVVKLTRDDAEARFVAAALQLPQWPSGMIRYLGGVEIGHGVWMLWREEAERVGRVSPTTFEHFLGVGSGYAEFRDLLDCWSSTAEQAWEMLHLHSNPNIIPSKYMQQAVELRPAAEQVLLHLAEKKAHPLRIPSAHRRKGAFLLAYAREIAARMARGRFGASIGDALGYYWDHRILLPDTHENNVGIVHRQGRRTLVITDPGLAYAMGAHVFRAKMPTLRGFRRGSLQPLQTRSLPSVY